MTHLRERWFVACGVLVLTACGAEAENGAIASSLERGSDPGSAEPDVVADDGDEVGGAAGAPADEPGGPEGDRSPDTIHGVDYSELTGFVMHAPGSSLSGTVELYCCRAGTYDVYSYEGGSCDDVESWRVEHSARLAAVTCSNDSGRAPYVRDPSDATALAVVVYDAAGDAVGCADIAAD